MFKSLKTITSTFLVLFLPGCTLVRCTPEPLPKEELDALYAQPLAAPDQSWAAPNKALAVFYLGHSLIGRDIPAMVKQLAGTEHRYEAQLGWGASLKAHWGGKAEIAGFDAENAHPRYRGAQEAVDSGEYDALVLTEMVEIRDAVQYHESWDYLRLWAERGWAKNPHLRVYLYETWHNLDDPEGWLTRLELDLKRYWEDEILRRALADPDRRQPIYVIPAGQVFARFVRAVEQGAVANGAVGEDEGVVGITSKEALFAKDKNGQQDTIHVSDIGAYLVALTHYAVLYQRSPVGLPHQLQRADGSMATAPSASAAKLMQSVVWDVVTTYPKTGVVQRVK